MGEWTVCQGTPSEPRSAHMTTSADIHGLTKHAGEETLSKSKEMGSRKERLKDLR